MTAPDARDELRGAEDALAKWRHNGDDFRSLPEMMADHARARAAAELRKAADRYCGNGLSGRALHSLFMNRADALAAADRTDAR